LKTKPSTLFCKSIQGENSLLTRYLIDHSDPVEKAMHEKHAQLDAYLQSLIGEETVTEKIFNEKTVDILLPNETYEQRQLYYSTNKFWPLKQRATFPVDDIVSSKKKKKKTDFPM
jgi:hypothetical protein